MLVSRVALIGLFTSSLWVSGSLLPAQHQVPVHLEGIDLAPQVVVGPLGELEFVTTVTANNQGAAQCELLIALGIGEGTTAAQGFMINGERSSRFLYDVLPPDGARQFRISGLPGAELFMGAAEISRLGEASCVEAVQVAAKYEILRAGVVTELFSYPVSASVPLGMCASVPIEYVPGESEPGFAAVSSREIPPGAKLQHYLRDESGELIREVSEFFGGEHRARNLSEVFDDIGQMSGSWEVCFESRDSLPEGVYDFTPLFLNVSRSGDTVQLGMAPFSVVNRACLTDTRSVCLFNRFLVSLTAGEAGLETRETHGFATRSGAATFRGTAQEPSALVTVEDGCVATEHYWVIAQVSSGENESDFALTVKDTLTGEIRRYSDSVSPEGSKVIIDSEAFPICSDLL